MTKLDWDFLRPAIERLTEFATETGEDISALSMTDEHGGVVAMIVLGVTEESIDALNAAIRLIDIARRRPRHTIHMAVDSDKEAK